MPRFLQVVTWMATHSGLVTLTFALFTLELVQNVNRGTDNFRADFSASTTFHCRAMGKHASNWRHDVIILTFDLWVHRAHRRCVSWYPICIPSLKFVGLPIPKIRLIFGKALSGLMTSTFRPLNGVTLIFSLLCPSILDLGSGTGQNRCASGCVVECRICNREIAGSNLSLGYFAPRSTQPSIRSGSVNEYQLRLGRQRQVWLITIADERAVCR